MILCYICSTRIKGGWQRFYVILESHELSFFTDHKVRDNPSAKPLSIYCVLQSTISPYTKDKKKSVFQVNKFILNGEVGYKGEWPGHGVAIILNKRIMADVINHLFFNTLTLLAMYVSVLI